MSSEPEQDNRWRDRANCRETASFIPWFDLRHGSLHHALAAALCDVCPVREECKANELAYGSFEQFGYRAGLSANQRRSIIRIQYEEGTRPVTRNRTDQKPCGTTAAYRRHLRADEEPCTACKEANAEATRAYEESRGLEPWFKRSKV